MTAVQQIVEVLEREHGRIDDVAGSLLAWSRDPRRDPAAIEVYLRFLRRFVSARHHRLEEEILFPALVEHAEAPADRGPLAVLEDDHRTAATLTDRVGAAGEDLEEPVRDLVHHLWEHVDKEQTVLLPEAAARLRRAGVAVLGAPPPDEEAAAAWRGIEPLLERWPPADDPEVVRGAGCIACAAFAVTCGGIEKEWWSDWERLYHRSLDEG